MPAASDTTATKANRSPMPRVYFASVTPVTSAPANRCARTRKPASFSRPNQRGNTPPRAIARGTSPCSRTKPFSVPSALTAASSATICVVVPSSAPPRKSVIGAGEAATAARGTNVVIALETTR